MIKKQVLRVGIGGPVGSGKTALINELCKHLREKFEIAVVTNDISTKEDAQFLIKHEALEEDRIIGVETGGCPHTAIREDASMNLSAVDELCAKLELDMLDNQIFRLAKIIDGDNIACKDNFEKTMSNSSSEKLSKIQNR